MKVNKTENREEASQALQLQTQQKNSASESTTEREDLGQKIDPRIQQWQSAYVQTNRGQKGQDLQKTMNNSPQIQRYKTFQEDADAQEKNTTTDDLGLEAKTQESGDDSSTSPSDGATPPSVDDGATTNIPNSLQEKIEVESGISLGDVVVHYNSTEAIELNVNAFAKGNEVFLAPGAENYLEEELWHVVQQKQGIVQPTGTEDGMPVNDAPHLESEARSGSVKPKAVNDATTIREVIQKNDDDLVFYVTVEGAVTGEHLMQLFEQQIYGRIVSSEWSLYKGTTKVAIEKDKSYGEVGKHLRYKINVPAATYKANRVQSAEGIGVEIDEENNIVGASGRSTAFEQLPDAAREPLLDEIDRRYHKISGKEDVENDEEQRLWDLIRDEVLAQRERVFNRSEKVNQVIRKVEEGGLVIEPKDYPRMLQLVQRLEQMEDGVLAEYASRTTTTATSIEEMEQSLDRFEAHGQERAEGRENRTNMVNDLFGTNNIYDDLNVNVSDFDNDEWISREVLVVKHFDALEAKVQALGFDSLDAYQKHLEAYKESFWQESVNTGITLMQKYEHQLFEYEQRYSTTSDAETLSRSVEATGAEELYQQASGDRRAAMITSMPVPMEMGGYVPPTIPEELNNQATDQEREAEALVRGFQNTHPIMGEASFDAKAFAGTSPEDAKEFILDYIKEQKENIATVKSKMQSDKDYVFTLDNLMAEMFQKEGLSDGSVQKKIIQDHIQHIKDVEFWTSIGIAIIAIGLGVVSFGTGAVATAALVGGAALSIYDVSREFQKYSEDQAAHDVGLLSKDPSFGWVLLALVGAGLDVAAVVKLLKVGKLTESLEAFNDGLKTDPEKALAQLDSQLSQIDEVDEAMKATLLERAGKRAQFQQAKTSAVKSTGELLQLNDADLLMWAVYAIKLDNISNVDDFFKWLLDEKIIAGVTRESLEEGQILALRGVFEQAGENIRLVDGSMMGNLARRTSEHPNRYAEIGQRFHDEDIYVMVGHGKTLNLSNQHIEDVILDACRKNVNFDRGEVMGRMANRLEKQQESASKALIRAELDDLANDPQAIEFVRQYSAEYPKSDVAREIQEAGGYQQWKELVTQRMAHAEEFLAKTGQALPSEWNHFAPEYNLEFAERLKSFRGNDDLSYDINFSGGEGQLFQSSATNDLVLKRWYGKKIKDMPESIRLLVDARSTIDAIPELNKYLDVVAVGERGSDWIIRGFDPMSVPLKAAVSRAEVATVYQKAIELLADEKGAVAQLILKKLSAHSANLHWSSAANRILIIDMQ